MFRIVRHRHTLKTGVDSNEVAYGITSLSPKQADAQRLLALNRGHWTIENGNHRFRRSQDACLMHTRHGPAILNNTALAVIFHRGSNNVAAAVQEFAMDRSQAIRAPNSADRSAQPRLIPNSADCRNTAPHSIRQQVTAGRPVAAPPNWPHCPVRPRSRTRHSVRLARLTGSITASRAFRYFTMSKNEMTLARRCRCLPPRTPSCCAWSAGTARPAPSAGAG